MTKEEVIAKLKTLDLPESSYVAFGGCPLAVAGIREVKDIDLLVSTEALAKLKAAGWKEVYKSPGDQPLTHDIFEAHDNWDFSPYSPTLAHLQANATIVDGIPFASLEEVRKWKIASGGAKHLADVELIDAYLNKT